MEKEEEIGGADPDPPAPFPVNGRRGVEPDRGVIISVSGAGEDTRRRHANTCAGYNTFV